MLILTPSEYLQVQRNLRKRFPRSRYPHLVSVSIGAALANGYRDPKRRVAVCFYLTEKKLPRQRVHRLPEAVTVRLHRNGRWQSFDIPADFISLEAVVGTGAFLGSQKPAGTLDGLTTGLAIKWDDPTGTKSGQLSVGHATSLVNPFVTLPGSGVVGQTKALNADPGPSDLAVIELTDPVAVWTAAQTQPIPVAGILPLSQMNISTNHSIGYTLRSPGLGGKIDFRVGDLDIPVTYTDGPRTYNIAHTVRVDSIEDNAFGHGRSGTVWTVQLTDALGNNTVEVPFAIQLAGDSKYQYRIGYGQLLCELPGASFVELQLRRLENQLNSSPIQIVGYG